MSYNQNTIINNAKNNNDTNLETHAQQGYKYAIYALYEQYKKDKSKSALALALKDKVINTNLERALNGDANAMCVLGEILMDGVLVEKDETQAAYWYEQAAECGNEKAIITLSDYYAMGIIPEADKEKINSIYQKHVGIYLKKAKEHNDTFAMEALGDIYYQGIKMPFDIHQVLYWYQLAADSGNSDAMEKLAGIYIDGIYVPKDLEKATYWLQKAVMAGNEEAVASLQKIKEHKYPELPSFDKEFKESLPVA